MAGRAAVRGWGRSRGGDRLEGLGVLSATLAPFCKPAQPSPSCQTIVSFPGAWRDPHLLPSQWQGGNQIRISTASPLQKRGTGGVPRRSAFAGAESSKLRRRWEIQKAGRLERMEEPGPPLPAPSAPGICLCGPGCVPSRGPASPTLHPASPVPTRGPPAHWAGWVQPVGQLGPGAPGEAAGGGCGRWAAGASGRRGRARGRA